MTLPELLGLGVKVSIVMVVLAIGLGARPQDMTFLARRPGLLFRSLAAMNLVMLVLAVGLTQVLDLSRPVAVILVALSLSPVPPVLPGKQTKAGGDAPYAVSLLLAAAIFAFIWTPLTLGVLAGYFDRALEVAPARLAMVLAMTVIAPLAAGVAFAAIAPSLAARLKPLLSLVGALLLAASLLGLLVLLANPIAGLIGSGALVAFGLFSVVGLAVGHALGGPDPSDRTVLALATATRHPGVALAVAQINFPDEHGLLAAVILYLLLATILAAPYVAWRKRLGAGDAVV